MLRMFSNVRPVIYPTNQTTNQSIDSSIQDYNALYQEVYVKLVYTKRVKYYNINRFLTISQFITYIQVNAYNDFNINQETKHIEIVEAGNPTINQNMNINTMININPIINISHAEESPPLEPSTITFQQKYGSLQYTPAFYIRIVDRNNPINNENNIQ